MSKRKDTLRGSGADCEVGYGKPPRENQFKPGQSGNPAGRRKGTRNLKTDVQRTLKLPVRVNGRRGSRNISTQEGVLLKLRENALQGDPRALDRLLEWALRFNNDAGEIGTTASLGPDDQSILDAYAEEIKGVRANSTSRKSAFRRRKGNSSKEASS